MLWVIINKDGKENQTPSCRKVLPFPRRMRRSKSSHVQMLLWKVTLAIQVVQALTKSEKSFSDCCSIIAYFWKIVSSFSSCSFVFTKRSCNKIRLELLGGPTPKSLNGSPILPSKKFGPRTFIRLNKTKSSPSQTGKKKCMPHRFWKNMEYPSRWWTVRKNLVSPSFFFL